jgi:dTDP-4-dehydrorhamnose reductase
LTAAARPKALITGAQGQVGRELQATAPPGWEVAPYGSDVLDVTREDVVRALVERERPTVVIHAAAYTAVDAAETDLARAEAVNAGGAALVAKAAHRIGARLIHLSTDYVFDGAQGHPYAPADTPRPLGVYGRTKLAGERAVAEVTEGSAVVLRTSWVYGGRGRNFVLGMLRAMRERKEIGVVSDQVGVPTWTRSLAAALWRAAERSGLQGVHHWTDAGVASWFDFAVAIQEEAAAAGLLERPVPVRPLRTGEYPAAARRPAYSVLDASASRAALDLPAVHWRVNLRAMLRELADA